MPGLPPLLACLGLLALWEVAARTFDISGLPPAHEALRELPAILTDPESLLNILAFDPPHGRWASRSRSPLRSRSA